MNEPAHQTLSLGEHLKRLRLNRDLTLAELASITGRSASSLSGFESEGGIPNAKFVREMAKALDTDPNTLLQWEYEATPEVVWRFYRSLLKYEIKSLSKSIYIEMDGSALVKQTVEGLLNQTGTTLRLVHRIFTRRNLVAQDVLRSTARFNWIESPYHDPSPISVAIEPSSINRAYFEPRFSPSEVSYSYSMEYRLHRAFRMTDAAAKIGPPELIEWTQFYVERPVKQLDITVSFDPRYKPRIAPACEVWRGERLYDDDQETVPAVLKIPNHIATNLELIDRNSWTISVRYPIHGMSYGLVWRPMRKSAFILAYPDADEDAPDEEN